MKSHVQKGRSKDGGMMGNNGRRTNGGPIASATATGENPAPPPRRGGGGRGQLSRNSASPPRRGAGGVGGGGGGNQQLSRTALAILCLYLAFQLLQVFTVHDAALSDADVERLGRGRKFLLEEFVTRSGRRTAPGPGGGGGHGLDRLKDKLKIGDGGGEGRPLIDFAEAPFVDAGAGGKGATVAGGGGDAKAGGTAAGTAETTNDENAPRQKTTAADDGGVEAGTAEVTNENAHPHDDPPQYRTLKAYLEPPYTDETWSTTPLPLRTTTPDDLTVIEYPHVDSCSKLQSQFPVHFENCPSERDPFLPWIHDVIPSPDGKFVKFVAQNKRRCNTGQGFEKVKKFMQPQVALFQHVPVKRVTVGGGDDNSIRYQLTTHEDADPDGEQTRFICRFQPSGIETLSVFPFNYDYVTWRKGYTATFTEEGFDNHMIWSSQLFLDCPVPPELQGAVADGSTVVGDRATLYVDLIPMRTKPRYGSPRDFLPPRHGKEVKFNVTAEWGEAHVLPPVESSGRWENVPICKPALMQKRDADAIAAGGEGAPPLPPQQVRAAKEDNTDGGGEVAIEKPHKLVACTWASTTFKTRGNAASVAGGDRRLREWITFHLAAGFDHVYVYDNSGAFSSTDNLKNVTDGFDPDEVTRIDWPAKICNNNRSASRNKGERSSQYAAESSCRVRFGPHTDWIAFFDTDEYLVPMGEYDDLKDLLRDVEGDDIQILSMNSQRSMPRFDKLEEPKNQQCDNYIHCFNPTVRSNTTILQGYNCEKERPPRKDTVPAEKQIYRADYVLLHFIHYSTVTTRSMMTESETKKHGIKWRQRYREQHGKTADELGEATMLHTKAVTLNESKGWNFTCRDSNCHLGFPMQDEAERGQRNPLGFRKNCFVNDRIEKVWVPRLEEALRERT